MNEPLHALTCGPVIMYCIIGHEKIICPADHQLMVSSDDMAVTTI